MNGSDEEYEARLQQLLSALPRSIADGVSGFNSVQRKVMEMKKEDHDALMKLQAQAAGKRMAERILQALPNKNPNGLNDFLKANGNVSDAEFYTVRDGYWEDPRATLKGRIKK